MKNITVSVSDDVHRKARITAAEHGTSVSALVAQYLTSLWRDSAEFERLLAQQRRAQAKIKNFSAGDRLSRDEVHRRAVR